MASVSSTRTAASLPVIRVEGRTDLELHARPGRIELGAKSSGAGRTDRALLLPLREHRQRDRHAAEHDLIAFFPRVADADAVFRLRETQPQLAAPLPLPRCRLRALAAPVAETPPEVQRSNQRLPDGDERSVHAHVALETQQLSQLAERQRLGGFRPLPLGPDPRQRCRARCSRPARRCRPP